ncbi:hypothetical protein L7B14_004215 [Salmonella enterica]|nr:hypothetical protein [Salmonella enterica]
MHALLPVLAMLLSLLHFAVVVKHWLILPSDERLPTLSLGMAYLVLLWQQGEQLLPNLLGNLA